MKKNIKKKLNSLVIGLGFGKRHFDVLKKNKNSNKVFACDFNAKLKKIIKVNKDFFARDYKKIIKNKLLNLVVIASYDNFHYQQILDSIKLKKNIFVEKPMCQTLKEFKHIKKLLKKNSKINFSCNFVLRNNPKFLYIKNLIDKGVLGKIYLIEGDYNYGRLHKLYQWRGKIPFYSVVQGGGLHIIDLILWLTKVKPVEVISSGNKISTTRSNFKYNDSVTTLINFKNNMIAKINSNFSCVLPHDHAFRIFGTKGTVFISNDQLRIIRSRKTKKEQIIKFKYKKDYKDKILNSFVSQIVNKKKPLISKNEILDSMNVCLLSEKSLKSKKWEKVL